MRVRVLMIRGVREPVGKGLRGAQPWMASVAFVALIAGMTVDA